MQQAASNLPSSSPDKPSAPAAKGRARRLLVITGSAEPLPVAVGAPAPRKTVATPQLRDAMTAAMSAARRVRGPSAAN